MQFKRIAFLTICSFVLFTACSSTEKKVEEIKNIKLTTSDAKTIEVEKLENGFDFKEKNGKFDEKAVLVNFFATWSEPSLAMMPHLVKLQNKYNENFEIISVFLKENKDNNQIKEFIEKYKINFTLVNSNTNDTFAQLSGGVDSVPAIFLYNKEGKLIKKYEGIVPQEMIEIDIKKAMK